MISYDGRWERRITPAPGQPKLSKKLLLPEKLPLTLTVERKMVEGTISPKLGGG